MARAPEERASVRAVSMAELLSLWSGGGSGPFWMRRDRGMLMAVRVSFRVWAEGEKRSSPPDGVKYASLSADFQ
jgi:hypothetical protein